MDPKNLEAKVEENKKIHDFLEPIEKTSVELSRVILSRLTDKFDDLVYMNIPSSMTKEKEKEYEEKGTDFGINILNLLASTDIPADYATRSIDKLIEALSNVKQYIDGTIAKYDDEILSRTFGTKSPVTDTYMRDCATLGTVMLTLQEIRDKQGNKPEDYFIVKK